MCISTREKEVTYQRRAIPPAHITAGYIPLIERAIAEPLLCPEGESDGIVPTLRHTDQYIFKFALEFQWVRGAGIRGLGVDDLLGLTDHLEVLSGIHLSGIL